MSETQTVQPIVVSLPRYSPAPQSLICPSWQETYFAPARNFSLNASSKSNLQLPPSCPEKRGVGHRHERWDGLRWTRQRRARGRDRRAVLTVSEHGAQDERRLNALTRTSAGSTWLAGVFGGGSCVRQNRVVLAPVAGVKPWEVCEARPGFDEPLIRRRR